MKIWNKLDEVLGATMLTGIATLAILLGFDGGVATACISGIIALLCVSAAKKKEE